MSGVGTELAKLNARIGFRSCRACERTANELNRRGVAWCNEHFDQLIRQLVRRAREQRISLLAAAVRLATAEPRLAWKIVRLKIRYLTTPVTELAAVCLVDYAIARAEHA